MTTKLTHFHASGETLTNLITEGILPRRGPFAALGLGLPTTRLLQTKRNSMKSTVMFNVREIDIRERSKASNLFSISLYYASTYVRIDRGHTNPKHDSPNQWQTLSRIDAAFAYAKPYHCPRSSHPLLS